MSPLTYGSLFTGIGGIDLGLDRAGMTCKWQVEINPYCRKVLQNHWPDVTRYADVKEVETKKLRPVDLIAGGFPCQDVSLAGERRGIEGERSGLWTEFSRIIRGLLPEWVLVENVPGLLSSDMGRFFGEILGNLAESGYDAEWEVLSAAAFGAPHLRERVVIVGRRNSGSQGRQPGASIPAILRNCVLPEWRSGRRDYAGRGSGQLRRGDGDAQTLLAQSGGVGLQERDGLRPYREEADASATSCYWRGGEPGICRVVDGVSNRMDRVKSLGNAVVPQMAEWIGRRIVEAANG